MSWTASKRSHSDRIRAVAALANLKGRGGEVFRRPDEALQPQELSRLKGSSSKRFCRPRPKVAETSSCSAQSSR